VLNFNFLKINHMISNKKGPTEILFNFWCKSSRKFNNGESPIVFRVIYRAQRKDIFTGISCPPKYWLKEERAVKLRYPAADEINNQLRKILGNAENAFQRLKRPSCATIELRAS